jgi:hypothetical protein
MSNSLPSVPSSPAELFKLNEARELAEHPSAFAEAVSELQEELEPTPVQGLVTAIQLVSQLKHYHFTTLEAADELELSSYQRELWEQDYKSLTKALNLLRQVSQD